MFHSDKPIRSGKEDKLGREYFAEKLANAFLNMKNADTFTVGLYGKWGSGKTSIVNMMLEKIEDEQVERAEEKKFVIVHFEPWNITNTEQLLTQFFIRLSSEFKSRGGKNFAEIAGLIDQYSDALEFANFIPVIGGTVAFFGKTITKIIGKIGKKFSEEKDIAKYKNQVIENLQGQKNKILVVIDDIDRLSNEQIRQVFQLVSSVAKFPNTFYLLVFDKEIVVEALKDVQKGNGEDYLEKVIQMPIQIPDTRGTKLKDVLLNNLDKVFSGYPELSLQKEHAQKIFDPCIMSMIENLREANRLCNSLQFKLPAISSEIEFTDMIAISALEIKYPSIYEWIKKNKPNLTGGIDFLSPDDREFIDSGYASLFAPDKTQQERYNVYFQQIQTLLENDQDLKDSKKDTEKIMLFLAYLFPYFGEKIGKVYETSEDGTLRRNNRIAHSERFNRYFDLDINNIHIKKADLLESVKNADTNMFKTILLKYDAEDLSYEFLEEVESMIPVLSSERAKIIIEALVNVNENLIERDHKTFFSVPITYLTESATLKLIDRVEMRERLPFMEELLHNSGIDALPSIAHVINMIELGYGRLSAEGVERLEYKKVVTIEELIQVEAVFVQRTKELLKVHSLFDFWEWRCIFYLMECFDSEFTKSYTEELLMNDANVLNFLERYVGEWTGKNTEYQITKDYNKYLNDDRVLQAIKSQLQSKQFFLLPEKTQRNCAVLYLSVNNEKNEFGRVEQAEIEKCLTQWRETNRIS